MDNEEMKNIVSGMIDRDTLIRYALEARDRQIASLSQENEQLRGLLIRAETLLREISDPFTPVGRYDVQKWIEDVKATVSLDD